MAHTPAALRIGHPGQHRQQARRIPGNLVCQLNEVANRRVNTGRSRRRRGSSGSDQAGCGTRHDHHEGWACALTRLTHLRRVARPLIASEDFADPRGAGGDHDHWHFEQFARYTLLDSAKNLAVRSHKPGFCISREPL